MRNINLRSNKIVQLLIKSKSIVILYLIGVKLKVSYFQLKNQDFLLILQIVSYQILASP